MTKESSDCDTFAKKDLEKYLYQSKRAMVMNIVFASISIIVAFAVWMIWSPSWWVYLLILSAGLFGLVGDTINIWYCKKKLRGQNGNN